jgi:microcystin degradation protein MlrC
MRLLAGQINQETNSFSPITADVQTFKDHFFLQGDEIPLQLKGLNTELAGFMDVVEREKCESVYTLATQAVTTGPLLREAFDFLLKTLLELIEKAGTIDGIYLALHGAMVGEDISDVSGNILHAVREMVGPEMRVVASVDLHANMTPLMIESVDAIDGYRTFPHTDFREVGARATDILVRTIKGEIEPEIGFCKISMILPAESAQTYREPSLKLVREIEKIESDPDGVTAFFCHVQPWLDIPDVGCSTVVVTNGNKVLAQQKAEDLAELFWSLRRDFEPTLYAPTGAIERAIDGISGTVVLLDTADGTSSGAPGDNSEILETLLTMKIKKPVYTMIVDSEAVKHAIKAGLGSTVSVSLGGKIDKRFSHRPVSVTAHVKNITDGVFRCEGPMLHGVEMHMGKTVVLVSGNISIVVMEKATFLWDPALYRSVNLEPRDAKVITVKCPVAAYDDIADEMIFVDTTGASSPFFVKMPFENILRPLYPFDDIKKIQCF